MAEAAEAANNVPKVNNNNNANFLRRIKVNNNENTPDDRKEKLAILRASPDTPNKTPLPTELEKVENFIKKNLYTSYAKTTTDSDKMSESEFIDNFKKLIKESGAIIYGSFLLYALNIIKPVRRDVSDIDILVHCKNVTPFNFNIATIFGAKSYTHTLNAEYCTTPMVKAGIRATQKFLLTECPRIGSYATDYDNNYNQDGGAGNVEFSSIDITTVRNKVPLENVIARTDFTFSQVWYDGEMVYANYATHLYKKVGYLTKDYIKLFLTHNEMLKKRLLKYSHRGYKIYIEPSVVPLLADIQLNDVLYDDEVGCIDDEEGTLSRIENPVVNAYHELMVYTILNSHALKLKDYLSGNKLCIPFPPLMDSTNLDKFDGYDTDTIIDNPIPELKRLRKQRTYGQYRFRTLELGDDIYHVLNNCITDFFTPDYTKNPILHDAYKSYARGRQIDQLSEKNLALTDPFSQDYIDNNKEHIPILRELMKLAEQRQGDDFFGNEGQLFDLHEHKEDQAITRESMEQYLQPKIREADKMNIQCYMHPECKKPLSLGEVRRIVSPEFFKKYVKGGQGYDVPQVPGENLQLQVLRNTPTVSNVDGKPDPFGSLYHWMSCPFCLILDEREHGCAYMTHAHRRDASEPFCPPKAQVKVIYQKYYNAAERLIEQGEFYTAHMEWCVICGRPCLNHQHFDLNDEPGLVPHTELLGDGTPNYSVCQGGGRAEGIARMLAIRKVVKETKGDSDLTPEDIRAMAAMAADKAAKDPKLMEEGKRLAELEPADEREFMKNLSVDDFNLSSNEESVRTVDTNNTDSNTDNNNIKGGSRNAGSRKRKQYSSKTKRRLRT